MCDAQEARERTVGGQAADADDRRRLVSGAEWFRSFREWRRAESGNRSAAQVNAVRATHFPALVDGKGQLTDAHSNHFPRPTTEGCGVTEPIAAAASQRAIT